MTPERLHDFFAASASVAGALIGLLFVAISVAGPRLNTASGAHVNRLRAHAALTTFLNALAISLVALVPADWLGSTALVAAGIGMAFVTGSLLSLTRLHRTWSDLRDATFLLALLAVLVREFIAALAIRAHPHDAGDEQTIAGLMIVCFLIGIARSWELIGAPPSIGIGHEAVALARRVAHRASEPVGEPDKASTRPSKSDSGATGTGVANGARAPPSTPMPSPARLLAGNIPSFHHRDWPSASTPNSQHSAAPQQRAASKDTHPADPACTPT